MQRIFRQPVFVIVCLALGVLLLAWLGRWEAVERASWVAALAALLVTAVGTMKSRSSPVADSTELVSGAMRRLDVVVREQWQREEQLRGVQDPVPMPVRWVNADPGLSDHWDNVSPHPVGTPNMSGSLPEVADVFLAIPSRRLVVLGRAGSGKTVLTVRLTLELLQRRQPGEPVPVILPIATWNPVRQSLVDWLTQRLATDYPWLSGRLPEGNSLADAIVRARCVLPVLDGLDEMPADLRGAAIRALNRSLGADDGVILTSRMDEYAAAVATADVLTAAGVVQLQPLTLPDLIRYLPRTTRRRTLDATSTKWDPVLGRALTDSPDTAARVLVEVLSTPLMTALARFAYSDTARDPVDLLAIADAGGRTAVEEHLLDQFVPAVFEPVGGTASGRWSAAEARRHLAFLARHMVAEGTQDLAWWRLNRLVPRRATATLALAGGALMIGLLSRKGLLLRPRPSPEGLVALLAFGTAFVLAVRRRTAPVVSRPRTRSDLLAAVGRSAIPAAFFGTVVLGLMVLIAYLDPHAVFNTVPTASIVAIFILSIVVLGVRQQNPHDVAAVAPFVASPHALLRGDRTMALALAAAFAPIGGLAMTIASATAPGGRPDPATAVATGFAAAVFAACAFTAWGKFSLVRLWLATRHRLPLRLMTFLYYAHQRGVLRQAGGIYQFRHTRLLHRLGQ